MQRFNDPDLTCKRSSRWSMHALRHRFQGLQGLQTDRARQLYRPALSSGIRRDTGRTDHDQSPIIHTSGISSFLIMRTPPYMYQLPSYTRGERVRKKVQERKNDATIQAVVRLVDGLYTDITGAENGRKARSKPYPPHSSSKLEMRKDTESRPPFQSSKGKEQGQCDLEADREAVSDSWHVRHFGEAPLPRACHATQQIVRSISTQGSGADQDLEMDPFGAVRRDSYASLLDRRDNMANLSSSCIRPFCQHPERSKLRV